MKYLKSFVGLATGKDLSYDYVGKKLFHKLGKSVLRDIAKELGYVKGNFEIRSNKGGDAVSGDVILHANNLYINLSQSSFIGNVFMYRSCKGMTDYCGGTNHWMKFETLLDFPKAIEEFRKVRRINL
jgi:hypothetical protein